MKSYNKNVINVVIEASKKCYRNIKKSIHSARELTKFIMWFFFFAKEWPEDFYFVWVHIQMLSSFSEEGGPVLRSSKSESLPQRIHKWEGPHVGISEMAIYYFIVKLKKILRRPSKCILSSVQSVHYCSIKK